MISFNDLFRSHDLKGKMCWNHIDGIAFSTTSWQYSYKITISSSRLKLLSRNDTIGFCGKIGINI